jgi:hypothetical protein
VIILKSSQFERTKEKIINEIRKAKSYKRLFEILEGVGSTLLVTELMVEALDYKLDSKKVIDFVVEKVATKK